MLRFPKDNFSVSDTLECGQTFRFYPFGDGYMVKALYHAAYVYETPTEVVVDGDDDAFFYDYFDLSTNYAEIEKRVLSCGNEAVVKACSAHKGIRILRQDVTEAFLSFIVSQNNNIPRIKSIIEKLCARFGEKNVFKGESYYAFPTVAALAAAKEEDLVSVGLGYRVGYIKSAAISLLNGEIDLEKIRNLPSDELRKRLLAIKGVGNKVADCVLLFGFNKGDVFPVDTWIEKLYKEDFSGTLTDRKKISEYFVSLFKGDSGIVQQYLFHAKRNLDI